MNFSKLLFLLSLLIGLTTVSCLKGDFDVPQTEFSNITQDKIISLNDVLNLIQSNAAVKLDLDKYLEVVVVADDKSGNFYKSLIVKDINGEKGVSVSIDETDLHAKYPAGQGVYIYLKDLYIGLYEGLPTLGSSPDAQGRVARIPAGLIKTIFFAGKSGLPVTPKKVNFSDLKPDLFNTLIEMDGFEFKSVSPTTTYADNNPVDPLSVNHTLTNCTGNEIVLRNSGFAEFAGEIVPQGNGKIVAVYSYYRNAAQLFIRDTNDLQFTGQRCIEQSAGNRIRVAELRSAFSNGTTTPPSGFVQGVVISDASTGNIVGQNMVIQDDQSGIVLRFSSNHNVPIGKEVKVILGGATMSEFNGLLQISTLSNSNLSIIGEGTMPQPREITVNQLATKAFESTLAIIKNAELSGGSTYGSNGGNITITDPSGAATLFTRASATFSGAALPTGKVNVTGIVSRFNNPQIQIRSTSDVTGGQPPVDPPTGGINENFNGLTDNQDINLTGWLNVAVVGTGKWVKKSFQGDGFAEARSFQDASPNRECWLITPEFDATKHSTLSFDSEMAFYVHDGLTVWATSDYTGNISTTTWTQLNPKLAGKTNANYERVASGNIDIKSFGAKTRVAFKYVGSSAANTTTYRVDNVLIK